MKTFRLLPLLTALALVVSCGKQQTEAERNAEVEQQVQQRLAAEKQTADGQRLAQSQADLETRERALADREAAAAATATPASGLTMAQSNRVTRANPTPTPHRAAVREPSERRSTASYGTFYRKLEPYGAWMETNDYGYVWQPKQAERSRSWRPYTDGHWVYTDAGWTWISEESFGWATYHYGRWVRLKTVGWCWVPGEEWAPAWVSWRSSNDYVGWAPLPPEARFDRRSGIHGWADNYYDIGPEQYAFVSANELGSQRIERAVVPAEQNISIVNQTTNVTNITYNNTTIVNGGPDYEQYRSRSQQPIERYRLETRTDITDESARPIVRGEMISMPAPVIGAYSGYDRPVTVREHLTQAVVENGWAAITDRSAVEKTRAKMKAESTPPPSAPARTFVKPEVAPAPSAAEPSATAAAIAKPSATATPTPVPVATPVATPKPTPVPTPEATATPTPAPAATVAPTPAAEATAASTPPAAVANPREVQRRAADERHREEQQAKAAAQEQKRMGEAAKNQEREQARQAQRAEQERVKSEQRNARHATPVAAPVAEAAETAPTIAPRPKSVSTPVPEPVASAIPEQAAPAATPPSAIVTPPASEQSTDARRHSGGKKDERARRVAPAESATAVTQEAAPNPVADASAAPSEIAAPVGVPVKQPKHDKSHRQKEPKPLDGAGPEPSPAVSPAAAEPTEPQ